MPIQLNHGASCPRGRQQYQEFTVYIAPLPVAIRQRYGIALRQIQSHFEFVPILELASPSAPGAPSFGESGAA